MAADTFLTVASECEGVYRDRGSRFLSFASRVRSEEEVKERVDALRRKHFGARHVCYAYRLGVEGARFRASDDGEPPHSAGRPILGAIVSLGVTDTLVVVVRYFGGVLLGVGGLVQAYRQAAADALLRAGTVAVTVADVYELTFAYAQMDRVLRVVREMKLEYDGQDYLDAGCVMRVRVGRSVAAVLRQRLELIESVCMQPAVIPPLSG